VFEMTVVRKSVRYSTGDGVSQTARRLELEARKAAHDATDRASSVACTDKRHGTRLCRRGRSESVGQSSESNAGRLRERTTTRAGRLACLLIAVMMANSARSKVMNDDAILGNWESGIRTSRNAM